MNSYILFHSRGKSEDSKYLSNFTAVENGLCIEESYMIEEMRGKCFPTIEHAFQATKLVISNASQNILEDLNEKDAKDAKSMGTKTFFKKKKLVLDVDRWNKMSTEVMKLLITYRYNQDSKFRNIVNRLKNENIALKHFERPRRFGGGEPYWGCYLNKNNEWIGTNMLGKLIEEI